MCSISYTGGKPYTTDVSDRHIAPRVREEVFQGSRALGMPFSDYTSILAEVGVLGFLAIVIMYLAALLYAADSSLSAGNRFPTIRCPHCSCLPRGLLRSPPDGSAAELVEVTRITFPAWILLAVVTKEFHCRYRKIGGESCHVAMSHSPCGDRPSPGQGALVALPRRPAHPLPKVVVGQQLQDPVGELGGIGIGEDEGALSVRDGLADRPPVGCDDWDSAANRLQDHSRMTLRRPRREKEHRS